MIGLHVPDATQILYRIEPNSQACFFLSVLEQRFWHAWTQISMTCLFRYNV